MEESTTYKVNMRCYGSRNVPQTPLNKKYCFIRRRPTLNSLSEVVIGRIHQVKPLRTIQNARVDWINGNESIARSYTDKNGLYVVGHKRRKHRHHKKRSRLYISTAQQDDPKLVPVHLPMQFYLERKFYLEPNYITIWDHPISLVGIREELSQEKMVQNAIGARLTWRFEKHVPLTDALLVMYLLGIALVTLCMVILSMYSQRQLKRHGSSNRYMQESYSNDQFFEDSNLNEPVEPIIEEIHWTSTFKENSDDCMPLTEQNLARFNWEYLYRHLSIDTEEESYETNSSSIEDEY